jgi:phosphate transport system ATP-binding protein
LFIEIITYRVVGCSNIKIRKDGSLTVANIIVKNLNVFYGKKQVLKNIDTKINSGRITAIIGQSGCGKSTFLKSINRIVEEENGRINGHIYLDEEDILKEDSQILRRKIGLVFQQPEAFPMSIEKNLSYIMNYHFNYKKLELKERIKTYLQMVGLYGEVKEELSNPAKNLSGGQKQRLAIARCLCLNPEVLLLDEPCSALDLKNTLDIEKMLLELKKKYTIVLVTHNLSQAKRIADDVIFMSEGEIVEEGSSKDIFSQPKSRKMREYIEYMEG